MIIISPVFVLLVIDSFVDFTTRALPEFLYSGELYHLENDTHSKSERGVLNEITIPENLTEDQLRKKLCPHIPEEINYSYRYESKSKTCDQVGEQSVCGNNMVLFGQRNNTVYGNCDCASFLQDRTLIYHEETNQCYSIFEKGYCREGQMLTLSEITGKPLCKVNPCRKQVKRKKSEEYVVYNYECVLLGSTCGRNKVVRFVRNFILPKCESTVRLSGFAMGAFQPICTPGSLTSMSGECQSTWVW